MSHAQNGEESKLLVPTARKAYESTDLEASRNYHDSKKGTTNDEPHKTGGGILKPMIFGGLDGILTSFAIVSGATGGNLDVSVVLVLGFSNIFADALAMGVGEFLSSKAESEWILTERKREMWEVENYIEGEIKEMVEIYENKGMSIKDAEVVVNTMAKYKDLFVDVMMAEELELTLPEDNYKMESFREGVIMFSSFAFFGSLPLLGYLLIPTYYPSSSREVLFTSACIVTGVVLFTLGSIKSMFSSAHWLISGTETLFLGGSCATIAYVVAHSLRD